MMATYVEQPGARRQLRQQFREQQSQQQQQSQGLMPQLSQQQRQAMLQQQQNKEQQQQQEQHERQQQRNVWQRQQQKRSLEGALPLLPSVPAPPAEHVMLGFAGMDDVRHEFHRLLQSFSDHLGETNAYVSGLPVRKAGTGGMGLSSMAAGGEGGGGSGGGSVGSIGSAGSGGAGGGGASIGGSPPAAGGVDPVLVLPNGAGSLKAEDEKAIEVGGD